MTSLSKWPPGGHIGFFWFLDSNFSLALNINSKLSGIILIMHMCRSLLIFSNVNFKMAAGQPYWIFCFRTLTLVWLWISTPNKSGTILIYMGRSLLIFSDVTFKMATWQPYWIIWFPDSNFTLALNINFKLHMHVDGGQRQKPIDFQWRHFQNGRLAPY